MAMKNKNPMLVALIALTLQFGIASAQQDLTKGSLIELRGQVNCLVPERGVLPDVVIFNPFYCQRPFTRITSII